VRMLGADIDGRTIFALVLGQFVNGLRCLAEDASSENVTTWLARVLSITVPMPLVDPAPALLRDLTFHGALLVCG
jgi:hypothetical protein